MPRIILFIGLAVVLCTCSKSNQQKKSEAHPEYTAVRYYECEKNFAFTAAYTKDLVRIILAEDELTLPSVVSASGAKYENDEALLWNKGEQLTFEYKSNSYTSCRNNSIESTWQKAKLEGISFRAIGQEPGWILEAKNKRKIRFAYNYGQDTVSVRVSKPVGEHTLNYLAETEAHRLKINITKDTCTDPMNGATFPLSVSVHLDKKVYTGCGRFL